MARGVVVSPQGAIAFLLAGLAMALAAVPGGALYARAAADPVSSASLCAEAIAAEEQRTKLPAKLLLAIAIAESGRYDRASRAMVAWPWTVHAEGRGRYFASADDAGAAVRALLARGVDNVDVGCMQINLRHHPNAFATIEDAFDPVANVAYAAAFLSDLAARTGSWFAAIGRYHASAPDHGRRYRAKVLRIRKAHHRRADSLELIVPEIEPPANAEPEMPIVIRGGSDKTPPARSFAPDRNALPMVLRGGMGRDRRK